MILSNNFARRSFGRIFVEKAEDVEKVREIVRRMDDFEYQFLPDDLITVFEPEVSGGQMVVEIVQTGKFDNIDLNELQLRCWMAGVRIFCWIGNTRFEGPERFDLWPEV